MDWFSRFSGLNTLTLDVRWLVGSIAGLSQEIRFIRESLPLLEQKIMTAFNTSFGHLNDAIAAEGEQVRGKLSSLETQLTEVQAQLTELSETVEADKQALLQEQAAKIAESIALVQGIYSEPAPVDLEPTEPLEPIAESASEPIEPAAEPQ